MNRSIIRKIAKEHGISVAEVRNEMQLAIDDAYSNPNATALAVPRKGAIPTSEELIDYCARVLVPQSSKARISH